MKPTPLRDKARLDWIENHARALGYEGGKPYAERGEDGLLFSGDSFRAAIDAAMQGAQVAKPVRGHACAFHTDYLGTCGVCGNRVFTREPDEEGAR